jgi:hypothetical protein
MTTTSQTNDRIVYTVDVRNMGPGRADGAMLVVPPVPGLVKTSVSCLLCPSQPSISAIESGLVLPGLPAGGSASLRTYRITSMAIAPGPVNVTAQVMAPPNVTDPVANNNSASLSATMSPPPAGPAAADLDVTVTVAGQRISGSLNNGFVDVTYDVVVWNHGPGAAHGAIVKVPSIAGINRTEVRCIPDSPSAMSCAADVVSPMEVEGGLVLPWLPSGRRVTIKITSNVPPAVASFVATASAAAPAGVTDASTVNNSAQVTIMLER